MSATNLIHCNPGQVFALEVPAGHGELDPDWVERAKKHFADAEGRDRLLILPPGFKLVRMATEQPGT